MGAATNAWRMKKKSALKISFSNAGTDAWRSLHRSVLVAEPRDQVLSECIARKHEVTTRGLRNACRVLQAILATRYEQATRSISPGTLLEGEGWQAAADASTE